MRLLVDLPSQLRPHLIVTGVEVGVVGKPLIRLDHYVKLVEEGNGLFGDMGRG